MEIITMPRTDTINPTANGASTGASPSAVRRFGRVPARWLEDPGIGVDELAVLTALAVHAGRDGVCVVRQRALAGLLQRPARMAPRGTAARARPSRESRRRPNRPSLNRWNL
jgi:hypothetical protein